MGKLKREFPLAWAWLDRNRKLLEQRVAFKRYFRADRDAFYSMLNTGDYTMAEWKVGWSEVANELDAAVIAKKGGKPTLANHTVVEIAVGSEEEAHYVCGVLNSTLFRFAVARYIVLHPDPHILDNLRIPKFDPSSKPHQAIAAVARRLTGGAADAAEPVHERLDELCAALWGVDERGLRAIQSAYRDLYVSAPKEQNQDTEADQ